MLAGGTPGEQARRYLISVERVGQGATSPYLERVTTRAPYLQGRHRECGGIIIQVHPRTSKVTQGECRGNATLDFLGS